MSTVLDRLVVIVTDAILINSAYQFITKCCIGLIQNDWTPLHIAAQTGQSTIVETLIRLGANVNHLDKVN